MDEKLFAAQEMALTLLVDYCQRTGELPDTVWKRLEPELDWGLHPESGWRVNVGMAWVGLVDQAQKRLAS